MDDARKAAEQAVLDEAKKVADAAAKEEEEKERAAKEAELKEAKEAKEVEAAIKASAKAAQQNETGVLSEELVSQLAKLEEPERASAWIGCLFEEDAESNVPQTSVWKEYRACFNSLVDDSDIQLLAFGAFFEAFGATFEDRVTVEMLSDPDRVVLQGVKYREKPVDLDGKECDVFDSTEDSEHVPATGSDSEPDTNRYSFRTTPVPHSRKTPVPKATPNIGPTPGSSEKRGRGRPRKHPLPKPELQNDAESPDNGDSVTQGTPSVADSMDLSCESSSPVNESFTLQYIFS